MEKAIRYGLEPGELNLVIEYLSQHQYTVKDDLEGGLNFSIIHPQDNYVGCISRLSGLIFMGMSEIVIEDKSGRLEKILDQYRNEQ